MAKRKRLSFDSPVLPRISGTDPETTEQTTQQTALAPIAGVVGDASANAALAEVSETLTEAREGGRLIMDLALDQIVLDHLVRDRIGVDDEDMQALKRSLSDRGQQVPIEVTRLGPHRYGLISGWRRCQALAALERETGDARFGTVQALIRPMTEAPEAYRAMVEENEIRVGLSYYERARIVARSVDQGVFPTKRAALQALFASASRAKRSKIGTFLPIVAALDGHLRFPQALTERVGLGLGRALEGDADLGARAVAALQAADPQSAADEAACLQALTNPVIEPKSEPNKEDAPPAPDMVCPGVEMTFRKGRLTLSGRGVDTDLAARVRALLEQG